jgi:hypothetical protein
MFDELIRLLEAREKRQELALTATRAQLKSAREAAAAQASVPMSGHREKQRP